MKRHSRWLVGWILAAALVGASSASAEVRTWRSGYTITVEPKMNMIPNTDVYYQRRSMGFDFYRYANTWYVVDRGNWYQADTWQGPFYSVDYQMVPEEVTTVPANYRRYWVAGVGSRVSSDEGVFASSRVFTKKPKMRKISNLDVTYAKGIEDFDFYRYNGKYYLVEDGVWYKADSWKGPFLSINARRVPRAVLTVAPEYRRHWTATADYTPTDRVVYWSSGRTIDVQPRMVTIPNTTVYYIDDQTNYDLYRYNNTWYLVDDGKWYRATTWRGPFVNVRVNTVPRSVVTVPVEFRHYWVDTGE